MLENEQYNAKKELSEIGLQISMGKATLADLEKNKEKYLKDIEVKEREIIRRVKEEARGLVEEIAGYHDEIKQFKNETATYVEFLKEMGGKMEVNLTDYSQKIEEFNEMMITETHALSELRKDIQNERELLDKEAKSLQEKKKQLEKDKKHLESQQKTLEVAYKQTQKLWQKK